MSKTDINEISINGVDYVRKGTEQTPAPEVDGMPYVIVRCESAGVFAGYLKERNGEEATILRARRLWYWSGAASLSQLAVDGTKKPGDCKFPTEVSQIEVTRVIEVLQVTAKAQESIQGVAIWQTFQLFRSAYCVAWY